MKRLQNTLYVNTQKTYIHKEGTNVVISLEKEDIFKTPIHLIKEIICFGNITVSPFFMGFCGEEGVGLSFHTETGKFLCRIVGKTKGNILLRRAQHKLTQKENVEVNVVKSILSGKLLNSRIVLQRFLRDHPEKLSIDSDISHVIEHLKYQVNLFDKKQFELEELRGVEGDAARSYFSIFDNLILNEKEFFKFNGRNRRPPKDPINALLSFAYTILCADYTSACESVGLDPQMGFLHADRPGRPSLALDLMEELRACFCDRLLLSIINLQQIKPNQFSFEEGGGVTMNDEARKTFLISYQKKKAEEVYHPFLAVKVQWGLIPHIQAQLLASYLRGDLDAYPPFFWK